MRCGDKKAGSLTYSILSDNWHVIVLPASYGSCWGRNILAMADCEEPAHGGSHKRPPTPFQCETEAVLNYIKQLRAENVSSVLVTHNLYYAYQVRPLLKCDRFAVMSYGQKVTTWPMVILISKS
jgi:hypothetical protein